jgi:hypothetical protein
VEIELKDHAAGHVLPFVGRWLLLALVGALLYPFARALGTYIYLGAPFFDWQWYVAIIIALAIAALRLMGIRFHRTLLWLARGVLLIWLVVGFAGFWQTIRLYPAQAPTLPISYWGNIKLLDLPETVLEDLRTTHGALYITAGEYAFTGDGKRSLFNGLQRLAEHDVDVYLAVVGSNFLSVPVHDEWATLVHSATTALREENPGNVRGLIGDAELPKNTALDLLGRDRASFFAAVADLGELLRSIHTDYPGQRLGVTAVWPLYLDKMDGDADLSIACRSSVDPPGNWDLLNSMTYSSYYSPTERAYYVYLVEQALARLYPDQQPSHLLGLIDQGMPGEPIIGFDDLVHDARLSRALGVPEIIVFKLSDRVLQEYGPHIVRQLDTAVNEIPADLVVEVPFSRASSILVFGTLFVDTVLDVLGWRVLLLIGWMIASGIIVGQSLRHASKDAIHARKRASEPSE